LKTNRFFVPLLICVIVFLAGVCAYQQRIIAEQSFEIRWLMANPARK
jgi:hypothetical protein